MSDPILNGDRMIRLPKVDSKENYLSGFWLWVEILADCNFKWALESLHWPEGTSWTPEAMRTRIATFYGGDAPWHVVVPNERLVGVINDDAQYAPQNKDGRGWFMAQIPLTTEPSDPKNDEIPFMGLATSFFVRGRGEYYVLEFEIFHL